MQMFDRRTAPTLAFDELCCPRSHNHSANYRSKFVYVPQDFYSRAFLQVFCLLRLSISTAGYSLQ